MIFSANARYGSLMVTVVFAMLMLSVVAISYFRFATSRQSIDLQLEQHEMARTIADAGIREAIERINASLFDTDSSLSQFLISAQSGRCYDLALPLSQSVSTNILPRGHALKLVSELEILAFSNLDHQNKPYLVAQEGHGILQIKVVAEVKRSATSRAATSELVTVLDYVVSSMTPDEFVPATNDGSTAIYEHPLVLRANAGHIEFDRAILNGFEVSIGGNLNNPMASYWSALIPEEFYRRYALWALRGGSLEDLRTAKVICDQHNRLNINGIIHCREPVTLDGSWSVRGRGVLVAKGFVINGSMVKEQPEDFIILYADSSDVILDSNGPVQAGIIAAAGGRLIVKNRLNVEGLVVADNVRFDGFTARQHQITYDSALAQLSDQLCVSISRWPNLMQSRVMGQVSQ